MRKFTKATTAYLKLRNHHRNRYVHHLAGAAVCFRFLEDY